ncbi:MAG: hypothetical protein JWN73_3620, partial [Betaproteobacteria bacterium]|nr:hypothetical protein [Betaproteobacteria bacterium]
MRIPLLLLLGSAVLTLTPAHAGEVYKWTDSEGHVHFGDAVPREAEKRAKPFVVRDPTAASAPRNAPPPAASAARHASAA